MEVNDSKTRFATYDHTTAYPEELEGELLENAKVRLTAKACGLNRKFQ